MFLRKKETDNAVLWNLCFNFHFFVQTNFVLHDSLVNKIIPHRHWSHHIDEGASLEAEWNKKIVEYEKKYRQEAAELKSIISGELPSGWDNSLPVSASLNSNAMSVQIAGVKMMHMFFFSLFFYLFCRNILLKILLMLQGTYLNNAWMLLLKQYLDFLEVVPISQHQIWHY